MEAAHPALQIAGLVCRYGVRTVLRGIDLRVASGSALALLGPNGAGKTTLLRVVAGLLRPHAGTVEVLGHRLPGDATARGRTAFVSHEGGLYGDLSARENLDFFVRLHGGDSAGVGAMLERVGLAEAAQRRVADFSRGMRQRLAIARALVTQPSLLLLDEPFEGLDRDGMRRVTELLATERARGTTLVMVLHDTHIAARVAGEAVVLDGGRIVWHSAGAALTEPGLAAAYDERETA